jgi:hypothetical protein
MGSSSKHILDKIDRIRAKGAERRADRISDVRFGSVSLYQPATNRRVFTPEQINQSKAIFREELKKRDRRLKLTWFLTILITSICFYLAYLFFTSFAFQN